MFDNIHVPGLCVYGEHGLVGDDGLNGSSVYFINYDAISSSNKNALLNNIEQSLYLDGTGVMSKGYSSGDLIICTKTIGKSKYNNVYKLVRKQNGAFSYDFEYVGRLSTDNEVVDVFDAIDSFSFNILGNEINECKVPVTRSYDLSDATNLIFHKAIDSEGTDSTGSQIYTADYKDALRVLFGFKIQPKIVLKYKDHFDNYDFYLKITIKNKKTILGKNSLPVSIGYNDVNDSFSSNFVEEPTTTHNNDDLVQFEKIIEIPVSKYFDSSSYEYKPYFISDMACDKLHPSKNNYCTSFFDPFREKGYKTDSTVSGKNFYGFYFKKLMYNRYSMIGTISDYFEPTKYSFLSYCIKNARNTYKHYGISSAGCDFIQNSKRKSSNLPSDCIVNFRSGESAYFSGMLLDGRFPSGSFRNNDSSINKNIASMSSNTFDNYVAAQRSLNSKCTEYHDDGNTYFLTRRNSVLNYVCTQMRNFIFNSENTFELVCVDTRTGRTKSQIQYI